MVEHPVVEDGTVQGYDDSSYGDGFADVYDEWYQGITDTEATVGALLALAQPDLPVLELGVGTGRLAVPLAAAGATVHGVDTSEAMLARLAQNDPHHTVHTHHGDMVSGLPDGPFGLVFVAYNTLFNLRTAERQQQCFHEVAARLAPGAAFVIEAFVPDTREGSPFAGSQVSVRSLTTDRVVLSVSISRPDDQLAEGQYIDITEGGGVRLRPWAIRYAPPAELDDMAAAAGLRLVQRMESFEGSPFVVDSARHVSVYRTIHTPVRTSTHSIS